MQEKRVSRFDHPIGFNRTQVIISYRNRWMHIGISEERMEGVAIIWANAP